MTRAAVARLSSWLLCALLPWSPSSAAAAKQRVQAADKAEIVMSGFRPLAGGRSLIFVDLSEPVAVEVSSKGRILEYKLIGARVPLRNNRNPLLLRDFDSAALTAVLVPEKEATRLVITLRREVTPSHRFVKRAPFTTLEVELPRG